MEFLAIPDVAADPASLRKNAIAIREMFEKRGVHTRLLASRRRARGLRRNHHARRDPHHRVLCPLRRPAARSQGVGQPAFQPTLRETRWKTAAR